MASGSSENDPLVAPDADFHIDPETLLPVVRGDGRALTMTGIRRAMNDDDARIMEAAGWIKPGDPIP